MPATRHSRHHQVSTWLTARDDAELAAMLAGAPTVAVGVGGGCVRLDVEGVPVFAKRIPISDRELASPHSTANLFDLPTYCQYGIGGPTFNVWRELAANLVVSEAVLAGETESFPLLHHWRVLPGRPPTAAEHLDVDAVLARVGGAPAAGTRLAELAAATHSLVLFLEHVGFALPEWLNEDPVGRIETAERQISETVAFLRDHELLHMDGHLGNMRSDGDRIHLVDFGLATSPRFDLSEPERGFVARHAGHDAGYAAMVLVNWLVTTVGGVPTPVSGGPVARNEYVRRCAGGDIPADVPTVAAGILARHAPAAARMNEFYWRLFDGDVHAEYPGS
ncbi:serine/threonine protein phosphatase [Plantactinospora sp. WMMB782]|uniref:serine/threonine protein phosphatase n=1 Tax=Plantactinospora sp. WMMB782 TaxID=3404121 RepID=UPI003B95D584